MKTNIPKTKKECFALLDEMLSQEDKQAIIEKDVVEDSFHALIETQLQHLGWAK